MLFLNSDIFQYSLHSISPFAPTCCSTNRGTFSGGNSMSAWLQMHMDSQLKVDTILWGLCSYFGSASVPKWPQRQTQGIKIILFPETPLL